MPRPKYTLKTDAALKRIHVAFDAIMNDQGTTAHEKVAIMRELAIETGKIAFARFPEISRIEAEIRERGTGEAGPSIFDGTKI